MPATSPFLINLSTGTSVTLGDIGLKGDEAFLLVHSVEDSADFGREIKHFNLAGEPIYHGLQDPYFRLSYDADCLSFQGLANLEPGKVISPANLLNYLPGALGHSGTKLVFRRPRRRRIAANLASLQFEVDAISLTLSGGGATSGGVGTDFPTDDGSTTVGNTTPGSGGGVTPDPDEYAVDDPTFLGQALFARRVSTLTLGSDMYNYRADLGTGDAALITWHFYSFGGYPEAKPVDLTDFTTNFDGSFGLYSELKELYSVSDATHLLSDGGGNEIPGIIAQNIDPRLYNGTGTQSARFVAFWEVQPFTGTGAAREKYSYLETYLENHSSLQAFLDVHNDGLLDTGTLQDNNQARRLVRLYDASLGDYLYP